VLFKFPDWMYYYLEYLPSCIEGYPIDRDKQKEAIEKYMNVHPDDENYEEDITSIIRHTINLLIELHDGGELIPPGTEYV